MYLNNTVQSEFLIYYYPEKYTTNKDCIPSIKAAQEARLMVMFDLLDKQLEGRTYLIGNEVTVCDYFLLMVSIWGRNLQRPPLSLTNIEPYLRRLADQDVVKRVFEKEGISLEY